MIDFKTPKKLSRSNKLFLAIAISLGFWGDMYNDAAEIAAGTAHHYSSGRGAGLDFATFWLAHFMGPNGILLVGGGSILFLIVLLIRGNASATE